MSHKLTHQSNLESLRKEAKRWLKALNADDLQARERLAKILPDHGTPVLRVVQHALALEYGFPNWGALKRELEERVLAARSHAERVALFLEKSAIRYSGSPGSAQSNAELVARLLARHPGLERDSIHTAAAAHDVEAVREFLAKDPALANQPGGSDGWTPLLRLAYTRIPIEAVRQNAVAIATALLDHGADPNVAWLDPWSNRFTVVTGVIGGGEGGQSAHPEAEPLARLLLARGAESFDLQALYNTSLGPDSTQWLELLWAESERRGQAARWTTVGEGFGGGAGVSTMDYLLGNAVPEHPGRAEWLLQHGASATTINSYSKQTVIKHAVVSGNRRMIDLLVRHGAKRPELSEAESFLVAAMEGDLEKLKQLVERQPKYLRSPHVVFNAIGQRRLDAVRLLLDLGMSPDVADATGCSALHVTTNNNSVEIAALLIARGASIDPVERTYNSTPLGRANYFGRAEMVALLAPLSRDIRGLCFAGAVERLAELLAADRSLAAKVTRGGGPPLFDLPDDDDVAVDVVEVLLAHGADPTVRSSEGLTPAQAAKKRGLDEAAAALGIDPRLL